MNRYHEWQQELADELAAQRRATRPIFSRREAIVGNLLTIVVVVLAALFLAVTL